MTSDCANASLYLFECCLYYIRQCYSTSGACHPGFVHALDIMRDAVNRLRDEILIQMLLG